MWSEIQIHQRSSKCSYIQNPNHVYSCTWKDSFLLVVAGIASKYSTGIFCLYFRWIIAYYFLSYPLHSKVAGGMFHIFENTGKKCLWRQAFLTVFSNNVVMERKHRHIFDSISPVTSQYVNRQYTVASLTFPTTTCLLLRTFDDNGKRNKSLLVYEKQKM